MEVTLEGSNSAETLPPWGGVIGLHRCVTGNLAVWLNNYFFFFFVFVIYFLAGHLRSFLCFYVQ